MDHGMACNATAEGTKKICINHAETLRSVPVMWPGDLAAQGFCSLFAGQTRDRSDLSLRRPEDAAATFWLPSASLASR